MACRGLPSLALLPRCLLCAHVGRGRACVRAHVCGLPGIFPHKDPSAPRSGPHACDPGLTAPPPPEAAAPDTGQLGFPYMNLVVEEVG